MTMWHLFSEHFALSLNVLAVSEICLKFVRGQQNKTIVITKKYCKHFEVEKLFFYQSLTACTI